MPSISSPPLLTGHSRASMSRFCVDAPRQHDTLPVTVVQCRTHVVWTTPSCASSSSVRRRLARKARQTARRRIFQHVLRRADPPRDATAITAWADRESWIIGGHGGAALGLAQREQRESDSPAACAVLWRRECW